MRFEELLRIERLGLAVVHAAPGALQEEVTGAYITDLPDPSRFLSVGDVVLTSGMWHHTVEDARQFARALARQHVAALIVGLVHLGHVPDDLLTACREVDLTVATISDRVSFKEVADAVGAAQYGADDGLARKGLSFNARLADRLARGEDAEAILGDFHAEFGVDCWLLDAIGTVMARGGQTPQRSHVGRVWNAMLGRDAIQPTVITVDRDDDDASFTCWPIPDSSQEVVGYFVCRGNQRRLIHDMPIVVDGVVGALRVDLEVASRWRQAHHSHVSELVRVLAEDAVSPGEVSALMRLEGLDPRTPTVVAAAEIADRAFPAAAALEMAVRVLAEDEVRTIGCVVDNRAFLLLNGEGVRETNGSVSPSAIEGCLHLLGGRQLRIGLSDPHAGVSQLSASVTVALDRLSGIRGGGPVAISASNTNRNHHALLSQLSARARSSFVQDLLGPLIAYDTRHGAELVATLRVFLQNTGAWQESARQLHLHTNTLRYRISRVEELTGRTLTSMDDRVDFHIALELWLDERSETDLS